MSKIKAQMLAEMIALAAERHKKQVDLQGRPYFLHVMRVMNRLPVEADDELRAIAIGHDLIEDTDVTEDELHYRGFSNRIIMGIVALTKVPGEEFEVYRARVLSNKDAMKVKMCDVEDNTDIKRLRGVTEKDHARIRKYHHFYLDLKEALYTLGEL